MRLKFRREGPADRTGSTGGSSPVPVCRAPSVAMQFNFHGTANACCANGVYNYGNVRDESIQEIWDGRPRQLMVEALDRGIYPRGCDICAVEHRFGNRDTTPAAPFDRYKLDNLAWPKQMELTLSNRCNLMCLHCNGENSSKIREKREKLPPLPMPYGEAFFEQLPPYLEHVEVMAFLGGEPFLSPETRRVWDMLLERNLHPEVQVTTNATIWNSKVERYVYDLKMHFAVSIDGATAKTYEHIRVGARYDRVIEIRDKMLAASRSYKAWFQINFCLIRLNWHELGLMMLQAEELGVPLNVIPVYQPQSHSLFSLPKDEMAAIVAQLDEDEKTVRPQLERNLKSWDRTMAMLRGHVERIDDEKWTLVGHTIQIRGHEDTLIEEEWSEEAVAILIGPTKMDDPAVVAAMESLHEWSGVDPVVVTVECRYFEELHGWGRIDDVVVPDWAASFEPRQWVGRPLGTVELGLSEHLGPVEFGELDEISPGILQREGAFASSNGPIHVRSLYIESLGRFIVAISNTDQIPAAVRP